MTLASGQAADEPPVALRELRADDVPLIVGWLNDQVVGETLGLARPMTLERWQAEYGPRLIAADEIWFAVIERASGRTVGWAYLYEIQQRHRRATFGITIGAADARGRGYGAAATRQVLAYAFDELGLHSVMLTVLAHNIAGIRAYERAGFRVFGHRRQASRIGQRLCDLLYMECIATEFGARSEPDETGT